MREISTCIFDVDGTLIDSTDLWIDAPSDYLASIGLKSSYNLRDMYMKSGYMGICYHLEKEFPDLGGHRKINEEISKFLIPRYSSGEIKEISGAKEFLEYLASSRYRCVLFSANYRFLIEPALEKLGILNFFPDRFFPTEYNENKHNYSSYVDLGSRLKVSGEECVMFEDSLSSLKNAKKFGMRTVGVSKEEDVRRELSSCSDFTISSYKDIYNWIANS